MNQRELEALLQEIRNKYDTLISFYRKKPASLLSFERRYSQLVLDRGPLELFLREELAMVNKLISREEESLQDDEEETDEEEELPVKSESFADRILGDLQKKQEKYPALKLHRYAAPEIARLYGALKAFYDKEWPEIVLFLDKTFPGMRNSTLVELEHTYHRIIGSRGGEIPVSLERYQRLLDYDGASSKDLQHEVQSLIKEAAFFLHDLRKVLNLALSREDHKTKAQPWLETLQGIISDFRIKDIHRSDQ